MEVKLFQNFFHPELGLLKKGDHTVPDGKIPKDEWPSTAIVDGKPPRRVRAGRDLIDNAQSKAEEEEDDSPSLPLPKPPAGKKS